MGGSKLIPIGCCSLKLSKSYLLIRLPNDGKSPTDENHVVKPKTGEIWFNNPYGFIASRVATTRSQNIFDLDIPEEERVDLRTEAAALYRRARVILRTEGGKTALLIATRDDETTLEDVGLEIGGLSESQARRSKESSSVFLGD